MENEQYHVSVGQTDLERMTMLGNIYADYNKAFILEQGLTQNMHLADIGCGPGNMTIWFAQQVGKKGSVVAIDQSSEQLDMLRQKSEYKDLPNIKISQNSIYDLNEFKNQFDFIFCRFLLMHLKQHELALQQLYNSLKPGGKLIIAELDNRTWASYPKNANFQKCHVLMRKFARLKGLHVHVFPKLLPLFHKINFHDITVKITQPVLSLQERHYFQLRNQVLGPKLLENGLISQAELAEIMQALPPFLFDERHVVTGGSMFQLCGTK